jgi:hypothetical protein
MSGTSACLKKGDILTLNQLLYGMMLPSGNDAAWALSEIMGSVLYHDKKGTIKEVLGVKARYNIAKQPDAVRKCSPICFIKKMNELCEEL